MYPEAPAPFELLEFLESELKSRHANREEIIKYIMELSHKAEMYAHNLVAEMEDARLGTDAPPLALPSDRTG